MWNVTGWSRLTAYDGAPLLGAREELLSWLAAVPEPTRTAWTARLKSDLAHSHHSVWLELYLYHYFTSNRWVVRIEPTMSGTLNKPDFLLSRGEEDRLLVEAVTVLDDRGTAQQTQILRRLADDLTRKLSRSIVIEPLSDLPPNLPTARIRDQVEHHAKIQASEVLEFDLSDNHLGRPFALKVIILPQSSQPSEPAGVEGTISVPHTIAVAKRIRKALEGKAGKYGPVDTPYLIALSVEAELPHGTRDVLDAVIGDVEWLVPARGMGVSERWTPNGFFTSQREGERRHTNVSAVLFYSFKWLGNGHTHLLRICHNPFALRPVNPDLFPSVPSLDLGVEK